MNTDGWKHKRENVVEENDKNIRGKFINNWMRSLDEDLCWQNNLQGFSIHVYFIRVGQAGVVCDGDFCCHEKKK